MARFRDLLPLRSAQSVLDGGEGNTRCLQARELGRAVGLDDLWVKVEADNPTRTTKDRQGTVVVAALREHGVRDFVMASTGNSCTAVARIVARFPDMRLHVFVGDEFLPRVACADAPNVVVYWLPRGTFVEACAAAAWFATRSGFVADSGFPFFPKREALKTVYFEAALQVPRAIEVYVQSVSSGIGVYATHQAARELRAMNLSRSVPRLVCAQEDSCDPLVRSYSRGADRVDVTDIVARPSGLAKATLRGDPSGAYPHLRGIVTASGGTMLSVGAEALRESRELAMQTEGLHICYASSATIAAARVLSSTGVVRRNATVLLNLSGADRPHSGRRADHIVERIGDEWVMTSQSEASSSDVATAVGVVLRESLQLADDFAIDPATVLLEQGLALDSVAVLELLLALETRFGVGIEESEVTEENLRTVGTLTRLIADKQADDV
jgi:threonine synthase